MMFILLRFDWMPGDPHHSLAFPFIMQMRCKSTNILAANSNHRQLNRSNAAEICSVRQRTNVGCWVRFCVALSWLR